MELPEDVVKTEIERYNELCHNGLDEDYGKIPTRLFPVENPPYYAIRFDLAGMLVVMGDWSATRGFSHLTTREIP